MITRRRPVLSVVLLLTAAGCAPEASDPVGPSFSRVTPGATFEWSVPERLGADADGDGLVDYPLTPEELRPASWRVDFDACGIPGASYQWRVDNVTVATLGSCTWSHEFPAEGGYTVGVKVLPGAGPAIWAEQLVTVQDWLIVSFGDSYGSGEGAPEVPQANAELVASFESLVRNLATAQGQLVLARASLQSAFEAKGLAQDILTAAQQRRSQFLSVCSDIESWADVIDCKNFLTAEGLGYDIYNNAKAFLDQAVTNATDRLNDLTTAYNAALGVVQALEATIVDIQGLIAAAKNGFVPPRWQPRFAVEGGGECHRSANAAPAQAAIALERSDPHTSVTFIHLACSGAQITVKPNNLTDGQVRWANALAGDREIDAVLVSIGGNDAGFANFATACAVQEPCDAAAPAFDPAAAEAICPVLALVGFGAGCSEFFEPFPEPAVAILAEGLARLPGRYDSLATTLDEVLRGLHAPGPVGAGSRPGAPDGGALRGDRVYITEYVDMTRGAAGAYCTYDAADPLATMPGFSIPDLTWLDLTAATGVNLGVQAAAAAHGWNYVTGIHAGYATHGYCAADHWVVRLYETFLRQGDQNGMAHPNVAGHSHNAAQIMASLMPDLYPDGPTGPPRAPDQGR